MIPEFDKKAIEEISKLLSSSRKIVITTHHKPDGDALGSSLALFEFLKMKGHDVSVVSPSDYPEFLAWMPGNKMVINGNENKSNASEKFSSAEIIFCLDFNDPARLEVIEDLLKKSSAKKILIDHHLDPKAGFDFVFSYPESCATAEIVFHLLFALSPKDFLNKNIAMCLYTGIMTDTGSFRYLSMTADTHRIIARLLEAGAVNNFIHENVYDCFSESRTRLLGYCIKDKLVVLRDYSTAYMSLSKEEMKLFNFQTGDAEGIVNYGLGIKGIKLAALFYEREGIVKISFRSKDKFSVKDLAAKHFNGGGHTNAAGGNSNLTLMQTIDKFISVLPEYKKELSG